MAIYGSVESVTTKPVDDIISKYSSNATQVFVYDTSLDSDGGAWRKRIDHTSWYNEDVAPGRWLGIHANSTDAKTLALDPGTPEIISNGKFTTTDDWTLGTDWSIDIHTGKLICTHDGVFAGTASYQILSTTTGVDYILSFEITDYVEGQLYIRYGSGTNQAGPIQENGKYSFLVQDQGNGYLTFYNAGNFHGSISNISLKESVGETATVGDYYQNSTNGYFYRIDASGETIIYRGNRREFPSVAILVMYSNGFIIYDGDHDTFPMWADWRGHSGTYPLYYFTGNPNTSVMAKNGIIYTTCDRGEPTNGGGLRMWNMIADKVELVSGNYGGNVGYIHNKLAYSELSSGMNPPEFTKRYTDYVYFPSANCFDVDIAIQDTAPIDMETGLPKATIAVSHNSGISIIKDDDTILNSSYTNLTRKVVFDHDGKSIFTHHGSTPYSLFRYPISDMIYNNGDWYWSSGYPNFYNTGYPGNTDIVRTKENELCLTNSYIYSYDFGITFVSRGKVIGNQWQHSDMICQIRQDVNTGWMIGDTRLALIGSIEAEDISGTVITTTPQTTDFTQSPWTLGPSVTVTNGNEIYMGLQYTGVSVNDIFTNDVRGEHVGQIEIELDIEHVSGSTDLHAYLSDFHNNIAAFPSLTAGQRQTVSANFFPTRWRTSTYGITPFSYRSSSNFPTVIVHGVTIRQTPFIKDLTNEYNSTGKNGVINGTITRGPVATDAELCACSGFTQTNYISRPNNAGDLDFGTGDFSVMCWATSSAASDWIFGIQTNGDNYSPGIWLAETSTNALQFRTLGQSSGTTATCTTPPYVVDSSQQKFHHIVALRKDGVQKIYVDGVERASVASTLDISNSNSTLIIGNRADLATPYLNGKICLFRVSGTAPTDEQIQKIYNDEKYLFLPGAKCTPYSGDPLTNTDINHGSRFNRKFNSGLAFAADYDSRTGLTHTASGWTNTAYSGIVRAEQDANKDYNTTGISTLSSSRGIRAKKG